MAKQVSFIGFIVKTICLLIGVAIIAPISLIFIIDPTDYKADIQSYLTEKSGYPIQLNGDIRLKLFPWIGLTIQDISIPQINESTPHLFSAKELNLKLPIRNLLAWEFKLDSLTIEEGHFYLVKEKDGSVSWDISKSNKNTKPVEHSESAQTHTKSASPTLSFSISLLAFKNGAVEYIDKQKDQIAHLKNITFHSEDFGQALRYPLKGSFDFSLDNISNKKPLYQGKASLNGFIPQPKNNQFAFEDANTVIHWQDKSNNKSHVLDASLKVLAKLQDAIILSPLSAKLDGMQVNGQITFPLTAKAITYDLTMDQLDLNALLASKESEPSAKIVPATYVPTAAKQKKTESIPDSKGTIKIKTLIYDKINAHNVNIHALTKKNTLSLDPVTAEVYDGTVKAVVNKALDADAPLYFKGNFAQVNMQKMLTNLSDIEQLAGRGNIQFAFVQTPNNLSGTTNVNITQGAILGLDLDYYLQMAENFIKKQPISAEKNNAKTPFNSLTATLMINQKIIQNEDLMILSDDYKLTGRGAVNLNQNSIDYDLIANKIYHDGKEHPNALPLAVSVKGPLNKPQVVPNVDLYMKKFLEKEGKKQINKQLEKLIGIDNEENTGTTGTDKSPEKKIEEKIEKEIEKGLKKIFKF
ncbi:AsmA family protein [Candidatus Berkiella cookevillensis]|uniref:AsmA family protein n=1 Tax=Candidatus Berkiella cookevillensis TaxID=437022 RepID=A0A0Q9YGF1_9GAMM|nr:AsmA family protein [Candidatus Berkiella cookevillensis]MCS5709612.1 AsmA family protein [Candidatus Berkiella cookevillensis]